MAARLDPEWTEQARAKVKTTQLLKRLQSFALSEPDPQTDRPVEMSGDQVRAALGLLKKTLPDLNSTELKGAAGAPLKIEVVRFSETAK